VILYADVVTGSLDRAIKETNRRRAIQFEYNKKNNITPQTIKKNINDIMESLQSEREKAVQELIVLDMEKFGRDKKKIVREKVKQMNEAVKNLDFETAAILRDEIRFLEAPRITKKNKNSKNTKSHI
jgi:excinuclease ABC subunit B